MPRTIFKPKELVQTFLNGLTDGPPLYQIAVNEAWFARQAAGRERARSQMADESAASQERQQEQFAADAASASQRFQAGLAAKKVIGVTVCSADNRLAYVEEIGASPKVEDRRRSWLQ